VLLLCFVSFGSSDTSAPLSVVMYSLVIRKFLRVSTMRTPKIISLDHRSIVRSMQGGHFLYVAEQKHNSFHYTISN